ncbi:MAG: aminotransferase class V-fold PLP-dependent enzyme [Gammaproteobacteria bacterium]|nr:aminotransferase class V-fold PLP-dependent enzyme [Pseudomonadales bacterium]MCP5349324.1 aminotransferase class V-fold PLP-dependent enzyme [Pseudomonadales bacterium]
MSIHKEVASMPRRRALQVLGATGFGMLTGGLPPVTSAAESGFATPVLPEGQSAPRLARDEAFWREVADYYDRSDEIVNLEQGYWGQMARPVLESYQQATQMVNTRNSWYARRRYPADLQESTRRVATALGVESDEIVLTRNATEAVHALLLQYRGLQPGDKILYSDIDYPSFISTMRWLEQARGVQAIRLVIPNDAGRDQLFSLYREAFLAHPQLKLALITHASNQNGLIIPVREISREARQRGIDIICDCAQSWGLVDFTLPELEVDWAGFNLHKWIGSPVGVGALYMRRGSLERVAPYPGESDPQNRSVALRVHTATSNFAANLAIPAALDFHQALGGANKEARLRYLRNLWTSEARQMSHIEVLGAGDEQSWSGIASFRLAGRNSAQDAQALQQILEQDYGIFTVARYGLESGACVRVTPQVFTAADEIGALIDAMSNLRSRV